MARTFAPPEPDGLVIDATRPPAEMWAALAVHLRAARATAGAVTPPA